MQFCAPQGVIDAGCGTGLVLAEVISAFAWGIGVDISPRMIRVARAKRLAKAAFSLATVSLCRHFVPRPARCFRAACCSRIMAASKARRILEAARFALVPGGFSVFDFLNEAARTQHRHAPENKSWFTGEEIQMMALRAGFSAITILGQPNRRVLLLLAET